MAISRNYAWCLATNLTQNNCNAKQIGYRFFMGWQVRTVPLVVDLDGTLVQTDMLHESLLQLVREKPYLAAVVPFWLSKGRAELKQQLAVRFSFDPEHLPYNRDFLDWLRQQKSAGRSLILCTGTDQSIATRISQYLGIFDGVFASDGSTNLTGDQKATLLCERYGKAGFDYAGNSKADLAVWPHARRAVVVNASPSVARRAANAAAVEKVFASVAAPVSAWLRGFRPHQWIKNLLLFVPFFAAHQISNIEAWLSLMIAFAALSLCASAVYVANDLIDLESDRQHVRKRNRPFASGQLSLRAGLIMVPILIASGLQLAQYVGGSFAAWLLAYLGLAFAYSLGLKRIMLVDCLVLAMLYTLRIVAGAAVARMSLSFWLLAFGVFIFLSLALVKRYAELHMQQVDGKEKSHGRGYYTDDAPLIQTMGVASGYAAVLILALYLNSDAVVRLYRTPEVVWGIVPVVLFWISRMWMQAHRGLMHDDPLVFAIRDKSSVLAGSIAVGILALGAVGWPWL